MACSLRCFTATEKKTPVYSRVGAKQVRHSVHVRSCVRDHDPNTRNFREHRRHSWPYKHQCVFGCALRIRRVGAQDCPIISMRVPARILDCALRYIYAHAHTRLYMYGKLWSNLV